MCDSPHDAHDDQCEKMKYFDVMELACMKRFLCYILLLLPTVFGYAGNAKVSLSGFSSTQQVEPTLNYGAEIFRSRCVLCHGGEGMGDGVVPIAIEGYPPTNLTKNRHGKDRLSLRSSIIYGGVAGKMSAEMPPWGDELTYTQIESVVMFTKLLIDTPEKAYRLIKKTKTALKPSFRVGRRLFKSYCVLCQGPHGEGNGKMARVITNPPPYNLTQSVQPDEYLVKMITRGGGAMGRSSRMPRWGQQLTKRQIRSVVIYIKTLRRAGG